jgi:hypothetical protein
LLESTRPAQLYTATSNKGILNHVRPKLYIATHYPIYRSWNAFGSGTVSHHAKDGLAVIGNSQRPNTEQSAVRLAQIGELSVTPCERLIGTRRKRHGRSVVSIVQIGEKSAMNGEPRGEADVVRDKDVLRARILSCPLYYSLLMMAVAGTINERSS